MAARTIIMSPVLAALMLVSASVRPAFAGDVATPATPSLSPPGAVAVSGPPARPSLNTAPAPAREESRWYGKQILIVDAIGAVVLGYGVAEESELVATLGIVTLGFGSPMVHAANGESTNMLLSIPLRVLPPIAGAAIGINVRGACSWEPCDGPNIDGMLIGAALGAAAASIVDAVFLARTRPRRGETASPRQWTTQMYLNHGGGVSAGVSGVF